MIKRPDHSKSDLSLDCKMLNEVSSTFGTYKEEAEQVRASIRTKQEQIDTLRQDLGKDAEKLLRIQGALSALQHLHTLFRSWTAEDPRKE